MSLDELVRAIVREELAAAQAKPTDTPAPDRLYTPKEAAQLLGIGRTTLYSEIALQRIRTLKVGRLRRVPAAAIAEYVTAYLGEGGAA